MCRSGSQAPINKLTTVVTSSLVFLGCLSAPPVPVNGKSEEIWENLEGISSKQAQIEQKCIKDMHVKMPEGIWQLLFLHAGETALALALVSWFHWQKGIADEPQNDVHLYILMESNTASVEPAPNTPGGCGSEG